MESLEYYIKYIGLEESHQINLLESDASGGNISRATIDKIAEAKDKNILTISGLRQDTFEYLISTYGHLFRVINFWKCPRVEALSAIESLKNIEFITYFWNQKITRLWDFKCTPKLKGLSVEDFTKLHDLNDLAAASNLEELEFGDKIWAKYNAKSLDPISNLAQLRRLCFSAKKIEDQRIEPLAELQNLEELEFPGNLFSTEQVAWLKARLPDGLQSEALKPFWKIDSPLTISGKTKDTFIVGKRKPFLSSVADQNRVEKYVQEFDRRVAWFKNNPNKLPGDFA